MLLRHQIEHVIVRPQELLPHYIHFLCSRIKVPFGVRHIVIKTLVKRIDPVAFHKCGVFKGNNIRIITVQYHVTVRILFPPEEPSFVVKRVGIKLTYGNAISFLLIQRSLDD